MPKGGNSWTCAVSAARKKLGIKGFQAIKKDSKLYNEAKRIHRGTKKETTIDYSYEIFTISPLFQ